MATKQYKVRTWLAGGCVETLLAESASEARRLAQQAKREWKKYSRHADVSYTNRYGKEVYVR